MRPRSISLALCSLLCAPDHVVSSSLNSISASVSSASFSHSVSKSEQQNHTYFKRLQLIETRRLCLFLASFENFRLLALCCRRSRDLPLCCCELTSSVWNVSNEVSESRFWLGFRDGVSFLEGVGLLVGGWRWRRGCRG